MFKSTLRLGIVALPDQDKTGVSTAQDEVMGDADESDESLSYLIRHVDHGIQSDDHTNQPSLFDSEQTSQNPSHRAFAHRWCHHR